MSVVPDTSSPPRTAPPLFGDYRCPEGVYDELSASPGERRGHWGNLVRALDHMGAEELRTRWEEARRMIHDHGVTYNVYADAQGLDRPWQLDMVPLIIPPD